MPATSGTLKVPRATLYYEVRGAGPLLLLIPGGPTDADTLAGLAESVAADFTAVAYDPRGNSRSVFDGAPEDQDMDVHADDAAALIDALGDGRPAFVFGSSGGAQIGLNLAVRHAAKVRALVAHEPPCVLLLDDPAEGRAITEAVCESFRREGVGPAMQTFARLAGLGPPPGAPPQPSGPPPGGAPPGRMGGNLDYFLRHGLAAIANFVPDIAALRAGPAHIAVGVGEASAGQLAHRSALALAARLGVAPTVFPGGHGGDPARADVYAATLKAALR